jgi:hypothetical protein
MDSPTVATVQALVIMSASEAASTRDARGWLYSGTSVQIEFLLKKPLTMCLQEWPLDSAPILAFTSTLVRAYEMVG